MTLTFVQSESGIKQLKLSVVFLVIVLSVLCLFVYVGTKGRLCSLLVQNPNIE